MGVRGIYCLNSSCKHYYEDNCLHMLEKDTIAVNEDGICETFEAGRNDGYLETEIEMEIRNLIERKYYE